MRKHYLYMTVVLVMIAGIFSSCKRESSGARLLPKDNAFVLALDTKALIESSDIEVTDKMMRDMTDGIAALGLPRDLEGKVMNLVKDPESSGVDLQQPVFLSLTAFTNGSLLVAGSLDDAEKFNDLVEGYVNNILKTEVGEYGTDNERFKFAALGDGVCMMYGGDAFLLQMDKTEGDDDAVANLMMSRFMEKEENSYLSTGSYRDLMNEKGAVKMSLSYKGLLDEEDVKAYRQLLPQSMVDTYKMFGDLNCLFSMNMEKGKADISFALKSDSKETMKMLKDMSNYIGEVDGDAFKFISKKTVFTMATNIDGKKYIEMFRKYLPDTANMPMFDMAAGYVKTVDGDLVLAFDMDDLEGIPYLAVYVETEDNSIVNNAAALLMSNVEELDDNEWELTGNGLLRSLLGRHSDEGSVYFGYKNDFSYFMISDGSRKPCRKVKDALDDGAFKGCLFRMALNVDQMMRIRGLKSSLNKTSDGRTMRAFLDKVEYIDFSMNDDFRGKIQLVMKDKDFTPARVLQNVVQGMISR